MPQLGPDEYLYLFLGSNLFFLVPWFLYRALARIPKVYRTIPTFLPWLLCIPYATVVIYWIILPFGLPRSFHNYFSENSKPGIDKKKLSYGKKYGRNKGIGFVIFLTLSLIPHISPFTIILALFFLISYLIHITKLSSLIPVGASIDKVVIENSFGMSKLTKYSPKQKNGQYLDRDLASSTVTPVEYQPVPPGSIEENLCPNCKSNVDKDMAFCGKCGASLQRACPTCSNSIRWFFECCTYCGANVKETIRMDEYLNKEPERQKTAQKQFDDERRKIREQIQQQKQKKNAETRIKLSNFWKKQGWWIAMIIVVSIVGIGTIRHLTSDKYLYNKASALEEATQWEEASAIFGKLGSYRDSHSRCVTCLFNSNFVTIPDGSFEMGSPLSEEGRLSDGESTHTVQISSYEIMSTEVTWRMWNEVMETNQSLDDGLTLDHPTTNISWNDCQEYIDILNELDPAHTYRLPSEAEWEYACRAGTNTRFYWGETDSFEVMGNYCWYSLNSNTDTNPVATKLPNTWGLYDMSGNVWEWCQDSYTGRSSAFSKVIRGGAWDSQAMTCRSATRDCSDRNTQTGGCGFRLVREEV